MIKFKNKYEFILGFVTLVISLSAFKEELSKIHISLGYITFSASDYFLYVVCGFSLCLYLYIMENVFRDTKIGTWNIWNYIIKLAYFMFACIILTPIFIGLNILLYKVFSYLDGLNQNTRRTISIIFTICSTIITTIAAGFATAYYIMISKIKFQEEIQAVEIIELENAQKLFNDKYYSQSVLESFKVLENHLYSELTRYNIRVQRHKFNDLLNLSIQQNIITQNEISKINELRNMRNLAAHIDVTHTKQQAEFSLNFIRELLERNYRKRDGE